MSGYRLVAPDDWFAVGLEPDQMERSVAALVKRQFAGIDNAPHLKAQAPAVAIPDPGRAGSGRP